MSRVLSLVVIGVAATSAGAQENPAARYVTLSAPDCAGPANIIAELSPAPLNATYLRVQHIGDPGTDELEREIANVITWDVGLASGFHAPAEAQRGYRDAGPPTGASAFQLLCGEGGFLINSFQFNHSAPLVGEGPSASVARDLSPPPQAFHDSGSTLLIEANVRVPWSYTLSPPVAEGTAQVSFVYYARDVTSGRIFAHVIGLFDNRAQDVANIGREGFGHDGVVAFVSSPLAATDASGGPVEYVVAPPASATMRYARTWDEKTFFRAELPYQNFRTMLTRLKANALPDISTEPADWRIILFGVLGEIFPGTGREQDVSLGASVSDLALLQSRARPFRRF